MICPCCGQTTDAVTIEQLARIVSPTMGALVRCFQAQPGEFITSSVLAARVYQHDKEGGPDYPGSSLNQLITYNRKKLRANGYDIESRMGRNGGYRLIVIGRSK
jgi:polyhydroxyalkanoate synthesis regulator protein